MRFALLATAGLAILTALPAAQPARSRTEAAVPFLVGETLTYDVAFGTYLVAGTAITKVQERRAVTDGASYVISVEGRPIPLLSRLYNLLYRMETMLDSATLLPHRVSMYSEEGARRRTSTTRFDRGAARGFLEVEAETRGTAEFEVPPQVQDGLSALFVLRTMSIKSGDTFALPVADEGTLYTVRASVGPTEPVTVPLGGFNAAPLSLTIVDGAGQPAATNAAVWISTDGRRLPVKMQAELPVGSFVLLLRQATP